MEVILNQPSKTLQGQSEAIEQFSLFRFQVALGKGIKNQIKSKGCQWNPMCHGWLCPTIMQNEIKDIIEMAGLDYESQMVSLQKGIISTNPKIYNRETRLDILEKEIYEEDKQLLIDIYRYDDALRPNDFAALPEKEGKTNIQTQIESDFHERCLAIEKKKKEAEHLRKELSHLNVDPGEKILNQEAPFLMVDLLIQELFIFQGARTLQYCSDSFWRWNGIQYVEVEEVEIRQIIYQFLNDAKIMSGDGHLKNFNPNRHKVSQVIDALHAKCYQRYHPTNGSVWLDGRQSPNSKHLISFQNGLLSIDEWLKDNSFPLIPHTPHLLNINSLSFNFDSQAAEPKAWLEFLNAIWPGDFESQNLLQEWMGYLLTQDTRQHKILLIIGPPRSGKGTIGRILRELLGHFNVAGPTLSSLSGEFGLQPFLNKLLVMISDARLNNTKGDSIIVERLLSISGEDPLTINRKFLSPLTVQLPARIVVMSNELPDTRDSSGALAKRYLVLTLKKSWLGNEDQSLLSRLQAELPSILLWALNGFARMRNRGHFIQPSSSFQIIDELEELTSPIKAFAAEKCEFKSHARIPIAVLFEAWRNWCAANGYFQGGNIQSFGKSLKAAFPNIEILKSREGNSRERHYVGITLNSL